MIMKWIQYNQSKSKDKIRALAYYLDKCISEWILIKQNLKILPLSLWEEIG